MEKSKQSKSDEDKMLFLLANETNNVKEEILYDVMDYIKHKLSNTFNKI